MNTEEGRFNKNRVIIIKEGVLQQERDEMEEKGCCSKKG